MYMLMHDIILCIMIYITVMQSSEMCQLDVIHATMRLSYTPSVDDYIKRYSASTKCRKHQQRAGRNPR
jgi:uncharacterized protein YeeX (DUF496 family)